MVNDSRGQCKLCLKECDLQNSHYIPKAFYKLAKKRDSQNRDVRILHSDVDEGHHQVRDYVFCKTCEDIFNKGGEAYVLRVCSRDSEEFELYDELQVMTPLKIWPDMKVLAASQNLNILTGKLCHYALGIVWKGVVHNWRSKGTKIYKPHLGDLEEQFRSYLLGEQSFPEDTSIIVTVSLAKNCRYPITTSPQAFQCTAYENSWYHSFFIPGIHFEVYTGIAAHNDLKRASINEKPNNLIINRSIDKDALTYYEYMKSGVKEHFINERMAIVPAF